MKGFILSGTGSGVGKTSVTTGILSKLSKKYRVQAFKTGPDFIDTMYHSAATGRPSRNLDSFMMPDDTIKNLVGHASQDADLCVIEGVRGLFEGFSGDSDIGSTAYLSKLLGFPVILVIDCRSLTRSVAAIINGFKAFDPDINIAGVILNKISGEQHENKVELAVKTYCDVDTIGTIRMNKENALEQRYLGLRTLQSFSTKEITPLESLVDNLDMDLIMNIAEQNTTDFPYASPFVKRDCGLKVAMPLDDAYCFYYRDNIECLESSGFSVETFSPVNGDMLPDADMYYLGGGYPELYAESISSNSDYLIGLKNASEEGKAILGECGGLMSMCNNIKDASGQTHSMSGIFDANSEMTNIRHGPTYVIAKTTNNNPLFKNKIIKAHEYHYSDVFPSNSSKYGFTIERGLGIANKMDGLIYKNCVGTYMHQHALSTKDWAKDMIDNINGEKT